MASNKNSLKTKINNSNNGNSINNLNLNNATSKPKLNAPKATNAPNTPKVNTPKVNTPKVNTPKANNAPNTPKVNTPKANNTSKGNNSSNLNKVINNVVNESEKKGFFSKMKDRALNLKSNITGSSDNTVMQIVIIVVVCALTLLLLFGIKRLVTKIHSMNVDSPWLIKGTQNGKNATVITQDPSNENSITLYRSHEKDGLEFTYTMWLCFMDLQYNFGKWKHIFHKGNKDAYPNRAPGLWLHPKDNILRVYMNTYDNILEYIDIDNIPLKKWIHVGIVVNQKTLDVYFNGKLRKRRELSSVPRQNFGNVWINMFGGFDGFISNFRYYRNSLEYNDMEKIVKKGPSGEVCGDTGQLPPYLDDNWWYDI